MSTDNAMSQFRRFGVNRRELLVSAAATALSAATWAAPMDRSRIGDAPVIFQRGFASVSYGQLHYRRAAPAQLSAPLKRTIVCFHQSLNSSQVFIEFMAQMARDRIVFAVDTPGFGESDLPTQKPTIRHYAAVMGEFLERLALTDVDVVGYHTGASIATELAQMSARRIHSMLLVGLALYTDDERTKYLSKSWPQRPLEDGSYLVDLWAESQRWRGTDQSDASVRRTFNQRVANGHTTGWGAKAVLEHDLESTLRGVQQSFLVVRPNDDLAKPTMRVTDLRPDVDVIDYPTHGAGIFEVQAPELARIARDFFDRIE